MKVLGIPRMVFMRRERKNEFIATAGCEQPKQLLCSSRAACPGTPMQTVKKCGVEIDGISVFRVNTKQVVEFAFAILRKTNGKHAQESAISGLP
ncbi:MAG: hypothetical protein IAG10_26250, partial [Planctomycetaceae bacterium]|nr:hypothetical protein [Planctomycetaceae bacterium]